MSVDVNTVQRVAELARLQLEPAELQSLVGEMNAILVLVDQLSAATVADVVPLTHPGDPEVSLREDAVGPELDEAAANAALNRLQSLAPSASGGYYLVPKVIE